MGINHSMLQLMKATALELQEAESSLELVQAAERSQQTLVGTLSDAMDSTKKAAFKALDGGDEAGARKLLVEKKSIEATKTAPRQS